MRAFKCHRCKEIIKIKPRKKLKPEESIPYLNGKPICSDCFNRVKGWTTEKGYPLFVRNVQNKLTKLQKAELIDDFADEVF